MYNMYNVSDVPGCRNMPATIIMIMREWKILRTCYQLWSLMWSDPVGDYRKGSNPRIYTYTSYYVCSHKSFLIEGTEDLAQQIY